jgi:hypothetical protein
MGGERGLRKYNGGVKLFKVHCMHYGIILMKSSCTTNACHSTHVHTIYLFSLDAL